MFVICSHYKENEFPVYSCVESIRNFYKDIPIVVVDTGSINIEYLDGLNKYNNLDILYAGPNYELGAWKKALYTYNAPFYVCIQDSVTLVNKIDSFFEKEFLSFYISLNGTSTMPDNTANLIFDILHKYNIPYKDIHVLVGSMFIINNKIKNKLIETSYFRDFLPKNKIDSFVCERVLYCLFESIGCDVLNSGLNNTLEGQGTYFNKKWLRRE